MAYLLDTNIISELRRAEACEPKLLRWAEATKHERHCLSVLSLGEIRRGIETLRRKAPAQCPTFEQWLERLQNEYSDEILPISATVVDQWGRLMAVRTFPVIDGLIAATALVYRLTLVTRNTADFADSGANLINPFT